MSTEHAANGSTSAEKMKRKPALNLLSPVSPRQAIILGIIGGIVFFLIWEIGHYMTPEESKRFLPSPQHVLSTLYTLLTEKG